MTIAFTSLAHSVDSTDAAPVSGVQRRARAVPPPLTEKRRAEVRAKRALALALLGSVCQASDRVYALPFTF